MEKVSIDQILQRRQKLDFEILKIDIQFDLSRLRQSADEIFREYTPRKKDGYDTYGGIGLQYSNSEDPVYDAVEQSSFISASGEWNVFRREVPRDFVHPNELAKKFDFVFDTFKEIPLFRGRLLTAIPGHVHSEHTDGLRDCRIHIPIYTHRFCVMFWGDRPYHMPADGGAYLCNTSRVHQFANFSTQDRTHLVFVI